MPKILRLKEREYIEIRSYLSQFLSKLNNNFLLHQFVITIRSRSMNFTSDVNSARLGKSLSCLKAISAVDGAVGDVAHEVVEDAPEDLFDVE